MRVRSSLALPLLLLLFGASPFPAAVAADVGKSPSASSRAPKAEVAGSNRDGRMCFGLSCWLSTLANLFRPTPAVEPQTVLVEVGPEYLQQQPQYVVQQPQQIVVAPEQQIVVQLPLTIPSCVGPHCLIDPEQQRCHKPHHCSSGVCVNGICSTACSGDGQCPDGAFCLGGACHRPQAVGGRCSRGAQCLSGHCGRRGVCVDCLYSSHCPPGVGCSAHGLCSGPVSPSCAPHGCPLGYDCHFGQCVKAPPPSCAAVLCPVGYDCQLGQCVKPHPPSCAAVLCPVGYVCQLGQCVKAPPPSCAAVSCPIGYDCQLGQCVKPPPPSCAAVLCPEGYGCSEGVCIPPPVTPCSSDSNCSRDQYCRDNGGGCQPKHENGKFCTSDNQCLSGQCVVSPIISSRTGRSNPAPFALPFSSRCQ